jgi:hypothetical protein
MLVLGVLRVLFWLLVLRLALRFVAGLMRGWSPKLAGGPAPAPPRATGAAAAPTDLVRDRVCNTFVRRERALVATVSGRQEHFCSAACRDRALTTGT